MSLTSIGAVLLGLLLYAGGTAGEQAELRAEAEVTERRVSGDPEVVVTLTNTGGAAAEEVVVEIRWGGETREISFTRVGKDEEITGSVIFPAGASGSPEVSVLSYNHP